MKSNIIRSLGFIVGAAFLVISTIMAVSGDLDLWVGFFLGPLFIYYGITGNAGFLNSSGKPNNE